MKIKKKLSYNIYNFQYLKSLSNIFDILVKKSLNEKNIDKYVLNINRFDYFYKKVKDQTIKNDNVDLIYDWSYIAKSLLFYINGNYKNAILFNSYILNNKNKLPKKYLNNDVICNKTFPQITATLLSIIYNNRDDLSKVKERNDYFYMLSNVKDSIKLFNEELKISSLNKNIKELFMFLSVIEEKYFSFLLEEKKQVCEIKSNQYDLFSDIIKNNGYLINIFYQKDFVDNFKLLKVKSN